MTACAAQGRRGRRRSRRGAADRDLPGLRRGLPARGRGRFRRAAAARLRAVARQRPLRSTTAPLPARPGRRVPGHQPLQYTWLKLFAGPGGTAVRGRRRRPIHLPLARRAGREPGPFRRDFPHAGAVQAGAELPLHRHDPRCRQRADREQLRAARQDAVDQRRGRRAGQAVRGLQRARRSRFRGQPHPRVDASAAAAPRGRDPVSLQCAIARFEEAFLNCAHALPGVRRPALLRARRDQGCAGVSAPDREPRRRHFVRAHRESAAARHRRQNRSTACASRARAAAPRCGRAAGICVAAAGCRTRRGRAARLHAVDRHSSRRRSRAWRCTSRSIT